MPFNPPRPAYQFDMRATLLSKGKQVKSQNGWSVIKKYGSPSLIKFPYITGSVRRNVTRYAFEYLCKRFEEEIEKIDPKQSWGFTPRNVAGTNVVSNHASGTAIDLNASKHPRLRKTFGTTHRHLIHKIMGEMDNCVRWGGDYPERIIDEMHFEINVSRAKLARWVVKHKAGIKSKKPEISVSSQLTKAQTKKLQRGYNKVFPSYSSLKVDGIYGHDTRTVTIEFQTREGITPDGIVGDVTKRHLSNYGIKL